MIITSCFLLASFKILFLSLLFATLHICVDVNLFGFIPFGILWVFLLWMSDPSPKLGNFLQLFFLQINYLSFSLFLPFLGQVYGKC